MKKKRDGFGLEVKSITGGGRTYLFFRTKRDEYHAFVEVEAKQAARDCGAKKEGHTKLMCGQVWKKN
jgi:hypothetical protein